MSKPCITCNKEFRRKNWRHRECPECTTLRKRRTALVKARQVKADYYGLGMRRYDRRRRQIFAT